MSAAFITCSSRAISSWLTAGPNHHQRIRMRESFGGFANDWRRESRPAACASCVRDQIAKTVTHCLRDNLQIPVIGAFQLRIRDGVAPRHAEVRDIVERKHGDMIHVRNFQAEKIRSFDVGQKEGRSFVWSDIGELDVAHFDILNVPDIEPACGHRVKTARLGIGGLLFGRFVLWRAAASRLDVEIVDLDVFDRMIRNSADYRCDAGCRVGAYNATDAHAAQDADLPSRRAAHATSQPQEEGALVISRIVILDMATSSSRAPSTVSSARPWHPSNTQLEIVILRKPPFDSVPNLMRPVRGIRVSGE